MRLGYFAVGFTPITTLALSLLEIVPLHIGGPLLVSVALALAVRLADTHPVHGRAALRGFGSGLAAVLIYDCTRLPFVIWGGWPDFIPSIGVWLFDDPDVHWSIGYLWRYLGNGGGMGIAFTMVARAPAPAPTHTHTPTPTPGRRLDARVAGPLCGVAVWSGLLLTLTLAPDGQDKLFVLTPATFTLSLVGHLVYGSVLGLDHHRHRPAARGRRRSATGP